MHSTSPPEPSTHTRRRLSFRTVLYLLFLGLVTAAVGTTGALAFLNGQRSAHDVAVKLRDEYSRRIVQSVEALLRSPERINALNHAAVKEGAIAQGDVLALERRFYRQLQAFPDVSWVSYGDEAGRYIAVERLADRFQIETSAAGVNTTTRWAVDENGRRVEALETKDGWQTTQRPWYRAAKKARTPIWTEPYEWYAFDGLCIDAARPVYNDTGQLLGVLETGFTLSQISKVLQEMPVGRLGKSFIVDSQGQLVASSAEDAFASGPDGARIRLEAKLSASALIRTAASFIENNAPHLQTIKDRLELDFVMDGSPVYLQVNRLPNDLELDWLIIVAIPEQEFMAHVDRNTRTTVLLCLAGLLVALLLGGITVRWIGRPLVELAEKAKLIQDGQLQVQFDSPAQDEIGQLTRTMGEMVEGLRERELIREAFGRYVDPELAKTILSQPDVFEPGGALQQVTVVMSDLRGFTSLTHLLGPAGMVGVLNRYLERMTEVIQAHDGIINDFVGDAILILFGVLDDREDTTDRAARCALGMQHALRDLNLELKAESLPHLEMGIGIHVGEVVVGNIGSVHRAKFGVVGDAVNVAARVESLTIGTQILISSDASEALTQSLNLGPASESRVKGRTEPLRVFPLLDDGERESSTDGVHSRQVRWPVRIQALRAKSAVGEEIDGVVIGIASRWLDIETSAVLEARQDLTLRISVEDGQSTGDVSAKVSDVRSDGVRAVLTWTSPTDRAHLGLT